MVVVEGSVFTVDGHGCIIWEVQVLELGYRTAVLHVGRVTTCAEDAADPHGLVSVCRGNQGTSCVVDQGSEFDREFLGDNIQYHEPKKG